MTTMTATDIAGQRRRSPVRLLHRVWTAIAETSRDADPLGVQLLVGCRFWHMPPSPMELEHLARVMSHRAGPIRNRL